MNVITIQKLNDGSYARSMLAYDTNDLAASAMYSTMASALVNENVVSIVCNLMGDNGVICQTEQWAKNADVVEE